MFTDYTNKVRELLELPPTDTRKVILSEDDLFQSWRDAMKTEVSGKWSAPVSRIIGKPCIGYHAIGYTDMNALMPCLKVYSGLIELSSNEDLVNKLLDQTLARNPTTWKLFKAMMQLSFETFPDDEVKIPTTEEIRLNIAEHKARKLVTTEKPLADVPTPEITDTNASITKAVKQVFVNLCKVVAADTTAGKKFLQYTRPMTGEFILDKFRLLHDKYGEEFEEACDSGDVTYICDSVDWSPLLEDEKRRNYFVTKIEQASNEDFEKIKGHLNHLNSFTRVQEHIPDGMMNKIESYTSGLLTQLKSGEIKFEDLDIEKIGKDVVDSSAEADVEQMGDNINELLPIIQRSGLFTQMMNKAK